MRSALAALCMLWFGACRAPDTSLLVPVSVLNWYPSGSAVCVPRDTQVWITFSTPLAEPTLTDQSVALYAGVAPADSQVAVARSYDALSTTVRLTPLTALAFDTEHTVRLDSDIAAEDGTPLAITLSSSFRTLPQTGCAAGPACKVDNDCAPQRCSVTGACVNECAVPDDCPSGLVCTADSCQ